MSGTIKSKAYVMVVCGDKEHTDTLKFSINILRKKTNLKVYIVTDNQRNIEFITDPNLVQIDTPKDFNHHQASIYLKTTLHKVLPTNTIYAYLDTDILAYADNPDGIFNEWIAPIRFAPDHCKIAQFSPYAVNCECMKQFESSREKVNNLIKKIDPLHNIDHLAGQEKLLTKRKTLRTIFQKNKEASVAKKIVQLTRYIFSYPKFKISKDFYFDKRKKIWFDSEHQPIIYHISNRILAKQTGLKWKLFSNELTLSDGRLLWINSCEHLIQQINKKFGVKVSNPTFQHWNGGVFLFSDESSEFMDTWHNYTMQIFKDPEWKTRDQGTLIATVWKLGLENHPTLNIKWNMILDYYNNSLRIFEDGSVTVDGKTKINPEFIHIYHHWMDEDWEVWKKVIQRI